MQNFLCVHPCHWLTVSVNLLLRFCRAEPDSRSSAVWGVALQNCVEQRGKKTHPGFCKSFLASEMWRSKQPQTESSAIKYILSGGGGCNKVTWIQEVRQSLIASLLQLRKPFFICHAHPVLMSAATSAFCLCVHKCFYRQGCIPKLHCGCVHARVKARRGEPRRSCCKF